MTKRASTSDPFNTQEDSLFFGQLMCGNEPVDKASIDTSGERKHISVAENALPRERSSFVQRLKLRESQPERPQLFTRQNEADSMLSIAETPGVTERPQGK